MEEEKLKWAIGAWKRVMKACNIKEVAPDNNSQETATLTDGKFLQVGDTALLTMNGSDLN